MRSFLIWLAAAVATGVCAGFLAIAISSVRSLLSNRQRTWLPYVTASFVWLAMGAVAQYGFHLPPWGWPAEWSNNLLASTAWLALSELISVLIARSSSIFSPASLSS